MSTNGHTLTGADIDPDAGLAKIVIKFNPVTKRIQLDTNVQDNVVLFGLLELAKIARASQIQNRSLVAVP